MTAATETARQERAAAATGAGQRERPSNLLYAADEKVPPAIANAFQHIALMTGVCLPFPVLIGQAAGLSTAAMLNLLSLSLVALGVGTFLQCASGRYLGSGYLMTFVFTAAYLEPSIAAAKLGGMSLLCGMTLLGGVVELCLSQIVQRLRPFFPAEIAGLCVTEIGIILGTLGMRLILGIGDTEGPAHIAANSAWGIGTLGLMIALQIWGKGMLRMLSVIIGMGAGVLAGLAIGIYDFGSIAAMGGNGVIRLPSWGFSMSLRPELIIPFVISGIACSMRAMGDITMSQRINDRGWIRPDMSNIRKGLAADGLGTVASALLGSVGGNTYSSSVAVANASGVASRFVSFWTAGLLIVLAAFPPVVAFFVFLPKPIMGAALVFTACFVLLNGIQIITSRLLDPRRTIVIGLSLVLSLSRDIFPGYYLQLPHVMQPFVGSDLVVALLTAMILNAVFRIGIKRRQTASLSPGPEAPLRIRAFFDENGAKWGARRDVIDRAVFGCDQALELIAEYASPRAPVALEARFDEFRLDVSLAYDGPALSMASEAPNAEELLADSDAVLRLGGYLLRRNADRVRSAPKGNRAVIEFQFLH